MTSNFSINLVDDSGYEGFAANISWLDQPLCQLNQDQGIDQIEIDFFDVIKTVSEGIEMRFPLEEFLRVLSVAKAGAPFTLAHSPSRPAPAATD